MDQGDKDLTLLGERMMPARGFGIVPHVGLAQRLTQVQFHQSHLAVVESSRDAQWAREQREQQGCRPLERSQARLEDWMSEQEQLADLRMIVHCCRSSGWGSTEKWLRSLASR